MHVFICTRNTPDFSIPPFATDINDLARRVSLALSKLSGGHLTTGHLRLRPTPDAVADHLLCDGSAVLRSQFPQLFAYIGTTYGAGDGVTTFNLPNFLGQTLAVPATAPAQVQTAGGTITTAGQVISMPVNVGRTRGGNVRSGGRKPRLPG